MPRTSPISTSTSTDAGRARPRNGAAALVIVLAVGAAALFGQLDRGASAAGVATLPKAVAPGKRLPYPQGWREDVRRAVVARPLDQARVNALYVAAVSEGDRAQARTIASVLGRLGWRYTPAQQNLMYQAAIDYRFDEVLTRSEALLRRQQLPVETLTVLHAMELGAAFRPALARALAGRPTWRTDFLTGRRGMASPRQLDARLATLELMGRNGGFTRRELAPFVRALADAGRYDDAFRLRRSKLGGGVAPVGLSDSKFERAAAMNDGQDHEVMPFEWQLEHGGDASAEATNYSGSSELSLRWNGNGVPIIARQRFRTAPGRYALRITGTDARADLLAKFDFKLLCPGRELAFDQLLGERGGALFLGTAGAIGCRYPELRMSGHVGDVQRRVDATLASIQLVPAGPAGVESPGRAG